MRAVNYVPIFKLVAGPQKRIVTICFMFKSGFHSFVLIKVIPFVGDGFSYFLLFEHSLRVAGHSC